MKDDPRSPKGNKELDALDEMIEEITVDAYGDDEKLWAFQQAFEENIELPADGFVKPIIARGARPEFEMEQVLPGEDPNDPFDDPITQSNDLKDAGERSEAL